MSNFTREFGTQPANICCLHFVLSTVKSCGGDEARGVNRKPLISLHVHRSLLIQSLQLSGKKCTTVIGQAYNNQCNLVIFQDLFVGTPRAGALLRRTYQQRSCNIYVLLDYSSTLFLKKTPQKFLEKCCSIYFFFTIYYSTLHWAQKGVLK